MEISPLIIYEGLVIAANMLSAGDSLFIVTSGNLSIDFTKAKIKQPFKECYEMAKYLVSIGVSKNKILKENKSKDTISNLYYLKTQILLPRNMTHLLLIVADFRISRLQFLCDHILGKNYDIVFEAIPAISSSNIYEKITFKRQGEFLTPMKDGDNDWLDDKFYSAKLYKENSQKTI